MLVLLNAQPILLGQSYLSGAISAVNSYETQQDKT